MRHEVAGATAPSARALDGVRSKVNAAGALFVLVAAGIVLNSFLAYPTQSMIGSAILSIAAAAYFVLHHARVR